MARVAPIVPADSDILCEGCGYTLNGLPDYGNCPECGQPITRSLGTHRRPSPFEATASVRSFIETTLAVLLRPAKFYSTLRTRQDTMRSTEFARCHRVMASVLFAFAAQGHLLWILDTTGFQYSVWIGVYAFFGALLIIFTLMVGVTALASWLSALEARYWGMRLPQLVVSRALRFHAASYVPVAVLAVALVWGYRALLVNRLVSYGTETWYLYTLCAAVIGSAAYLFRMYWIAMKSMMYANR